MPDIDTSRRAGEWFDDPLDRRGFGPSMADHNGARHWSRVDDIRAVMDAAGASARWVLEEGGALCTLFSRLPERVSGSFCSRGGQVLASSDYPWGWTTDEAEEWWQLIDRHWGTERFWEANSAVVDPAIRRDPERVKAWTRYARLSASPGSALAIERKSRETDIRALLKAAVQNSLMHRRMIRRASCQDIHRRPAANSRIVDCPAKSMPRSRGIGNACCENFKTSSHRSRKNPSWNEFSQPFSSRIWLARPSG